MALIGPEVWQRYGSTISLIAGRCQVYDGVGWVHPDVKNTKDGVGVVVGPPAFAVGKLVDPTVTP